MKNLLILGLLLSVNVAFAQGPVPPAPAADVPLAPVPVYSLNATIQPYWVHGNSNHLAATWLLTNWTTLPVVAIGPDGPVTNSLQSVMGVVTWPATVTRYSNGVVKYDLASASHRLDTMFVITNLYTSTDAVTWVPVGWHSGSGEPLRLFKVTGPLGFCTLRVTN